jgi:adenylate kinase
MSGKLQPEFLTLYVWIKLLISKYTGTEHIVFDGTPRKLHEAGVLDSMVEFFNLDKPYVINIDISKEEAKSRLISRGRMDDSADDIEKRLSWYETDVAPTISYYENNPRYNFIKIDGKQQIEEVFEMIKKELSL